MCGKCFYLFFLACLIHGDIHLPTYLLQVFILVLSFYMNNLSMSCQRRFRVVIFIFCQQPQWEESNIVYILTQTSVVTWSKVYFKWNTLNLTDNSASVLRWGHVTTDVYINRQVAHRRSSLIQIYFKIWWEIIHLFNTYYKKSLQFWF